ncbi:hypothetical protein LEMLEM_LOCUS10345 [Lemmus lemmus]
MNSANPRRMDTTRSPAYEASEQPNKDTRRRKRQLDWQWKARRSMGCKVQLVRWLAHRRDASPITSQSVACKIRPCTRCHENKC